MFFSIVIPTYNRQPILAKCLKALEMQNLANGETLDEGTVDGYEIVLVDDGSTDGTLEWLEPKEEFPHVRIFQQNHQGPAVARNFGVKEAKGDIIIFIDSDLVVTETFLAAHAKALLKGKKSLEVTAFLHMVLWLIPVILKIRHQNHTSLTDYSAAFFATGNVAIPKHWLEKAGLFDTGFQLYGWEDLELGVRLKN